MPQKQVTYHSFNKLNFKSIIYNSYACVILFIGDQMLHLLEVWLSWTYTLLHKLKVSTLFFSSRKGVNSVIYRWSPKSIEQFSCNNFSNTYNLLSCGIWIPIRVLKNLYNDPFLNTKTTKGMQTSSQSQSSLDRNQDNLKLDLQHHSDDSNQPP